MIAAGRVPKTPLAAVAAYVHHLNFGALPYAGGAFDQPAELLDEMTVVASAVNAKRNREHEAVERQLRRAGVRR